MGKTLLVALPACALVAFVFVQWQFGGVAPAVPVEVPELEQTQSFEDHLRTGRLEPTVLQPSPADESTTPPGFAPTSDAVIPPRRSGTPPIGILPPPE